MYIVLVFRPFWLIAVLDLKVNDTHVGRHLSKVLRKFPLKIQSRHLESPFSSRWTLIVPLNTDIMSRFISNSSFMRQRMRFFTPVVSGPLLHVNANNESRNYIHKKQFSIKEESHYQTGRN